ncbi:uncharacterized protein LOC120351371 isoform X2 [Nilaparvata lugens]|uniref:uncharacterized protein LOC120351371 isoform X2 n=1 Tax=Nilaparvata lugens TaxID=108931 RepID=UPI00193C92FE|nr:uncharacterized protein LOC120351371 isoform X2 [Nilaparvata lugens]
MAQCYYCNSSLPASGDVVTCFGCNNKFHFGCSLKESTYRRMSEDERKKWRCFHVCKNSKGATGIASPGAQPHLCKI